MNAIAERLARTRSFLAPELPDIAPMPPRVSGPIPRVGAGRRLLVDPTRFLAETRRTHGDTFVVDAFGYRLCFVFSPDGVRSLYRYPEREASFGIATYRLISHKAPAELFDGRRVMPHDLFDRPSVEEYLDTLEDAVAAEMDELGDSGRMDVFDTMRRLAHRLSLASWAGPESAEPERLARLIPLLDRLDTSESFVHPTQGVLTWATGKRRERAALEGIEQIMAEVLEGRCAAERSGAERPGDYLDQIWDAHDDRPHAERLVHVARDVVMIHLGSLSNLYAALAWTFVDVLKRPDLVATIEAGDDALLERCANESIRMAQRSLTLREVMQPVTLDDGDRSYELGVGTMVATMLSVTNTSAGPGLETYDPDHYDGRTLTVDLPAKELVSTFGHGKHSCPAARFSLSAIRISIRRLLERYEWTAVEVDAGPLRGQIGAIARADRPITFDYRRRR